MKFYRTSLFLTLFFSCLSAGAQQDTLHVTLRQADSLLVTGNLSLIALKYRIEGAKAQSIQAKLFQNPYFSSELTLYNPDNHTWFDIRYPNGNKSFALNQVFQVRAGETSNG